MALKSIKVLQHDKTYVSAITVMATTANTSDAFCAKHIIKGIPTRFVGYDVTNLHWRGAIRKERCPNWNPNGF